MTSNVILMALVPVFFVLLLGFVAGKTRIVDNGHVEGLNALVMDFALPASLDSATVGSMVIASTGFSVATLAIAIATLFPR